ncbi:MAG: ribonuclease III [Cyanobacteria bacterium P01_A01_bin.105]
MSPSPAARLPVFYLPDFYNDDLWQQAMTHKSYAKEQEPTLPDNERLEFLGDAILTFLAGEYLFRTYPQQSEGELTPLRAALVDAQQFSSFAQQLNLHSHLKLSLGAENSGSRQNDRILSSAFEALVGAYFLDQNDLQAVKDYILPMFDSVVDRVINTAAAQNHKSRLQEWALGRGWPIPDYVIVQARGPDHSKTFVAEVRLQGKPYGQGTGHRKQDAEKQAAAAALERIRRQA